jgi:ketosteroid isomerase-like protein
MLRPMADPDVDTPLRILIGASRCSTERPMTSRIEVDSLLRELYAARIGGDLEGVCRLFSADARFEIASANNGNPIAVNSTGPGEFRPLLKLLMRTFRVSDQVILSMIIDGLRVAVHWRANVYSRITGSTIITEFIDIVEIRDGRIASYLEFFVPR